jgi:hypothetical protein
VLVLLPLYRKTTRKSKLVYKLIYDENKGKLRQNGHGMSQTCEEVCGPLNQGMIGNYMYNTGLNFHWREYYAACSFDADLLLT